MCEYCKYLDNDPNKKPCSVCMQWVDGYLTATEYENKHFNKI